MKKLLLAIVLLVSTIIIAQETKKETSYYFSTGLSVTNSSDFSNSSYISAEVGVLKNNIAIGIVVGRNNLSNFRNDSFNNYWYEGKIAVYQPIGYVDSYLLGGIGSYIENGNTFIEYGAGLSKEFNNVGVFIQVSNWDNNTYITPGVSIGF